MANRIPERAEFDENVDLGDHDELLIFHLKVKNIGFTIGLSDILACLKFAEQEGLVPKLPIEWWCQMYGFYPELDEPIEEPDDKDYEML